MKDIEIIKKYFGFNNKEAKNYIKSVNENTMKLIKQGFEEQCKNAFYND